MLYAAVISSWNDGKMVAAKRTKGWDAVEGDKKKGMNKYVMPDKGQSKDGRSFMKEHPLSYEAFLLSTPIM